MNSFTLSLICLFVVTSPTLSANELDRLKALCEEQERQIRQLEIKVAELSNTPAPQAPSAPIAEGSSNAHYTVKSGDNIEKIAKGLGTSVEAICKLNSMKSHSMIHPGQKLIVPGKKAAREIEVASKSNSVATHTVAAGDTFYKIASKHGISVDSLLAANPKVNHKALRIGQKIQLGIPQQEEIKEVAAQTEITPNPIPAPTVSEPIVEKEPRISEKPILIEQEITYAEFATKHNTTTIRLDEINGYSLEPSTILARGSEIYVPVQP